MAILRSKDGFVAGPDTTALPFPFRKNTVSVRHIYGVCPIYHPVAAL